jgi:hypothetical protein
VLDARDFALAVGLEFDDIGREEEVEVATDTGDIAFEVVGAGTDGLDVSLTDAGDKFLAPLCKDLLGSLPVGDEDVLEPASSEGASHSGPFFGVPVGVRVVFDGPRLVL